MCLSEINHLLYNVFKSVQNTMKSARFGSTYTKIGTIQRRLAWPLSKDDTQIRERSIFKKKKTMKRYVLLYQKRNNFTTSQRKFSYPQNMYNHAKVASLVAQLVKNLPAMQKTLVQFLSQKDPLKKG